MSDGYPTKECLAYIRKWRMRSKPIMPMTLNNIEKLLDVIEENCRWADWSITYELVVDDFTDPPYGDDIVVKLYYSTGGWSGHEELISELEQTWFWMFCWEQSRRGGHYIFKINPSDCEDG